MASVLVLAGCSGSLTATTTGTPTTDPMAGATYPGSNATTAQRFQRVIYLINHTPDTVTVLTQRYGQGSPAPSSGPSASASPTASTSPAASSSPMASASPVASASAAPSTAASAAGFSLLQTATTGTAGGTTTGVQGGTQTQTSSPTISTTNVSTLVGTDPASQTTLNQTLSNNNLQILNLQNVLNNSNLLVSALNNSNVNVNAVVAVDVLPTGGLDVYFH
jgi:hypothetical protein